MDFGRYVSISDSCQGEVRTTHRQPLSRAKVRALASSVSPVGSLRSCANRKASVERARRQHESPRRARLLRGARETPWTVQAGAARTRNGRLGNAIVI